MEHHNAPEKNERSHELAERVSQQVLSYFRKRKMQKEEATIVPKPLPMGMEIVVRPWEKSLRIKTEIPFRSFFINEESGRGLVYEEVKKLLEGAERAFGKRKFVVEIQTRKGERILNIIHDCSAQIEAVFLPRLQPKPKPKPQPKPKKKPKSSPVPEPKPAPVQPLPAETPPPVQEWKPQKGDPSRSAPIDFKTMKFFPTDPSWRNIKKVFQHLELETGDDVMRMLGTSTPDHRDWDYFLNRLKQAANKIECAFGPKCEDTLYVWLVNRKKWMSKLPPRAWG